MAVSYKRLLHFMIERDFSNAQLMLEAKISAMHLIVCRLYFGVFTG